MLARDLVERIPTVGRGTSALDAAALIAEYRMAALIVADDDGVPISVIPGTQVLRLVVPSYVRDDAALAHVYDEAAAAELCQALAATTVGDLLDDEAVEALELPSVQPQDTLIEIAAVMVTQHTPVVLVRDRHAYHGAITFSRTMAAVAEAAGGATPGVQRRLETDLADHGEEPQR